jgi:hypothetical protein
VALVPLPADPRPNPAGQPASGDEWSVIGSAPGVTAVDAHRATDYFKALGRKMGEYTEGRAEVMRLREVE